MALRLVLPLFGLEPEQFSALNAKLLHEHNLRNSSDSGRAESPSAGSDSSGVSSLTGSCESTTTDFTPDSSRPGTPVEVPYKIQEKREEKISASLRVMYRERDILNLGANIRESFWQVRDPIWCLYDDDNLMLNHSICQKSDASDEQTHIQDCITKCCDDCGFCEPLPYLF